MSRETFINYWIGQEPNPPSPTLDQMPAYVNIVPLAFVGIAEDAGGNYELDFGFLTQHFPAEQIQGWIRTVQANGTKVLFSILDQKLGTISGAQLAPFVANVAANVAAWGVDGIDFDYEPPNESATLVPLIEALRAALPAGSVFSAPIYSPWAYMPGMLKGLAGAVDYVTTMDYTPYPGYGETISLCSQYAEIMGGWSKLVIGISCMGPATDADYGDFTPYADVSKLSAYEPSGTESKGGAMLYTFSYDVTTRNDGTSGTGYPDGTWTETIHANLP
ncbi:MAG TPA: glycosyl hydrolase family 18 protein [Allosphingosinicella sp.]